MLRDKDELDNELVTAKKEKDLVKDQLDEVDEEVQKLNAMYDAEKKEARLTSQQIEQALAAIAELDKELFEVKQQIKIQRIQRQDREGNGGGGRTLGASDEGHGEGSAEEGDLDYVYDTEQSTAPQTLGFGGGLGLSKRSHVDLMFTNPMDSYTISEQQYRTGTERSIKMQDKTFISGSDPSDISAAHGRSGSDESLDTLTDLAVISRAAQSPTSGEYDRKMRLIQARKQENLSDTCNCAIF